MATDVARLSLEVSVNGAKRAQSAMEALKSGSVSLTRATEEQIAAQSRLTSTFNRQSAPAVGRFQRGLAGLRQSFKLQKGATQQAGFQIQDFTTQIAAGQSATVAFGQQASQLAGILGPGGAVLGAVVAIGAAVSGVLINAFSSAEKSTESLTDRIGELRDNIDELTEAQIRGLKVEFFAANRERAAAIQSERENIRSLTQELTNLKEAERAAEEQALMSGGMTPQLAELQKEIRSTSNELELAKGSLQTYYSEADNAAVELKELIEGNQDAAKETENTAEKIRDLVTAAEQQAATIGLSARATATYEAALAGANAEQILAIDQAYQRIEAEKARQEALKETERREIALRRAMMASTQITVGQDPLLQRLEAQRRGIKMIAEESEYWTNKMAENQQQISTSMLGTMGNVFSAIETFTEKGTAEWAAMVLAQKGIMAAQAVMAANLAATLALASPMVGVAPAAVAAQAEVIRQIGYVNAGLILATGVGEVAASFDGGGYTGNGPRSGGLDGKGGFMAMMHPQETVIDHTRGQGMGGDVNVIVNNAPPGTRTEERTDGRGNRFVEVFIADIAAGGPMSKAVQGTYGLKRQGR